MQTPGSKSHATTNNRRTIPSFRYYEVESINACEAAVIAIDAIKENSRCVGSFKQYRADRHYVIFSGGSWHRSVLSAPASYDLISFDWMLYDIMQSWLDPFSEFFYQDRLYDFDYPKPMMFGYVGGTARLHRSDIMNQLLDRISPDRFYFKLEGQDRAASTQDLDIIPPAAVSNVILDMLQQRHHRFDEPGCAHWRSYSKRLFDQCYWQLVIEPDFHTPGVFFMTEKTVRPLLSGQPMVVAATNGFLARLRSMGFRTYHELWDESYDTVADHDLKQHAIVDVCVQLQDFDWQAHRPELIEIARHNLANFLCLHRHADQEFRNFETVMTNLS